MRRVLITGSRGWTDHTLLGKTLGRLHEEIGFFLLLHGDCKQGADALAKAWQQRNTTKAKVKTYPAEWTKHGKAAGPIRNTEMATALGKNGLCLAFWDGASPGTKDMIDKAKKIGAEVQVFSPTGQRSVAMVTEPVKNEGPQQEWWKKYRPKKLAEVIGQPSAVKILTKFIEKGRVPHALLFSGMSGCGKTSLARILRKQVGCGLGDFVEINAAEARGIDMVRELKGSMGYKPLDGVSRVYLLDEASKLTSDSQSSLLKILEDTPPHCYFFLATTDPQKLLPTIRTRCTEVKVESVDPATLVAHLKTILEKEKVPYNKEVVNKVAELSEGSVRKALVLLEQASQLPTPEEQLESLQKADVKNKAFDLVKALLWERPKWADVAAIIKGLPEGEDWEGLRHLILSCAGTEALKAGKNTGRAALILSTFQYNFFDSKKAGLIAACHQVVADASGR